MKTNKLVSALAGLGLGLALLSAPAVAAISWFSPITAFQDDDIDMIIDANGNIKTTGTIDVGDRLISVLEFNNSQGILSGQGPNAISPEELTGVADITVAAKILVSPGVFDFVFAPSGASGLLSGLGVGAMAGLFTDQTPDLNVINGACGNLATCTALAGLGLTDGSALWAVVGFAGDEDELWFANDSPDSIAGVLGTSSSTILGGFNYALSVLTNNTGQIFLPQACGLVGCDPITPGDGFIDVLGSGNILGGQGLQDGWFARSDTDFQVAVPEPGSLALLAMALLGAGAVSRRKVSKK